MSRHRDVMADAWLGADAADEEAPDVMSGLSNLADCMLVLVCGLMVALFVHWNFGVTGGYQQVENTDAMVEIDTGSTASDEDRSEETGKYEKLGAVYRDVSSGKLYYLLDEE